MQTILSKVRNENIRRNIFMKKSVLNSFHEIYSNKNNLLTYKDYYNALRLWVKKK